MDTNNGAAMSACPSLFFVFYKFPDSFVSYCSKIFNHAHAVSHAIAFVELSHARARINIAGKTVFAFCFAVLKTVYHFALDTIPRLMRIVSPASIAIILISEIPAAQRAIHAAGSDKGGFYPGG